MAAALSHRDNVAREIPLSFDSDDAETARGPNSRATILARTVSEYCFT